MANAELPPISAGEFIRAKLSERGWNQRALGIALGMNQPQVSKLLQGQRSVDAELALKLEEVFTLPAEEFLHRHIAHELAQARARVQPDPDRMARAQLIGSLPVAEMIARGWLPNDVGSDPVQIEAALLDYFRAQRAQDVVAMPHAARRSNEDAPLTLAQVAWLHRVRQIAAEMVVPLYSRSKVREAIDQIAELRISAAAVRNVPRILYDAGVRFVLVESLPGAKIDGVCLWLNDMAPVVAMTLRYDRIDNFFFVLRHELEHVLRGHGRSHPIIDAELEGERAGVGASVPEDERVANAAASDFCVPEAQMQAFWVRKAPLFSERDVLGFAATLRVHPGLVAGQIQHRLGRYDRFRAHLVKVREHVVPSAAADGWGAVYPVSG